MRVSGDTVLVPMGKDHLLRTGRDGRADVATTGTKSIGNVREVRFENNESRIFSSDRSTEYNLRKLIGIVATSSFVPLRINKIVV